MAKKPLPTPDQLRQLLQYEPHTGRLFWKRRGVEWFKDGYRTAEGCAANWNSQFAEKEALTATHSHGYRHGVVLETKLYAHRVAWAIHHGVWPTYGIDHINGDPSDNRIENLRDVPQNVNCSNTSRSRRNKSGVTGVHQDARNGKWHAQITVSGKTKHLGTFTSVDGARAARQEAQRRFEFGINHGTALD